MTKDQGLAGFYYKGFPLCFHVHVSHLM